jgi:hypothetical protein
MPLRATRATVPTMAVAAQRTKIRVIIGTAEGAWDDMVDVELDPIPAPVAYAAKGITLSEFLTSYRPRVPVSLPLAGIPQRVGRAS